MIHSDALKKVEEEKNESGTHELRNYLLGSWFASVSSRIIRLEKRVTAMREPGTLGPCT